MEACALKVSRTDVEGRGGCEGVRGQNMSCCFRRLSAVASGANQSVTCSHPRARSRLEPRTEAHEVFEHQKHANRTSGLTAEAESNRSIQELTIVKQDVGGS